MTERKMKDSGIPWIGAIPEEWELAEAKFFVDINPGSDPKLEGNIPVYGSGAISFKTCGEYKEGPAVLIGRKGTIDIPQFINGKYWNVDTAFDVKPKKFNIRLYYYLAQCFDYKKYQTSTAVPSMTQGDYSRMTLPIPPLAEQEAIAEWLDGKCGEIDELIEVEQKMIEELEAYRQATITEAVTHGLNPDAPMRQTGISWLTQIPEHWEITNIKFYSKFYNGDRTSRYPQPNELVKEGIPFLTSKNINDIYVDISVDETKFISKEKYDSLGGAKLIPNDIIYCLRGSIGKCALNVTLKEGTVASSLMAIRPQNIVALYLLFYLLSNPVNEQTSIFMNGTCAANLSAENVGNYSLPLPPLSEQQTIASYLDNKCKEIDDLIALKREKIETLKQYRQSIIFEAVTGKIQIN